MKQYYEQKWYNFIVQNFTIRWWEIDLIFEKNWQIVFVEVKVINTLEDIYGYIRQKKLKILQKAIQKFLLKNKKYKNFLKRLDVVFVKNWQIYDLFENVTM